MSDIEKTEINDASPDTLSILLYQHHLLRKILKEAREKILVDEPDFEGAESGLATFRKALDEHLGIEDGVFYPHIIESLEKKDINTRNIKEFIAKMKDISARAYRFLDSYPTATQMRENKERLQKEFVLMEEVLLIRISAEEESVYLYWDL